MTTPVSASSGESLARQWGSEPCAPPATIDAFRDLGGTGDLVIRHRADRLESGEGDVAGVERSPVEKDDAGLRHDRR